MNARTQMMVRVASRLGLAIATIVTLAVPAIAQEATSDTTNPSAIKPTERAQEVPIHVSYFRPNDARGLNVFEAPKRETVPYKGFDIQWGAAFTQQFQSVKHEHTLPDTGLRKLKDIGPGFNNAEANLYLNGQLARGIRVALTVYLSSRHHNEAWVKDGYLLVDGSPWENAMLDGLMEHLRLRLGHMEINYGDQHFRNTDNGQAMWNPLVGNYIMNAWTTEIGGEVYWFQGPFMAMAAVTGGEVRGTVASPDTRSPSFIGKLAFDKQVNAKLRARISGSYYKTNSSISNTLYSGSRSGSRYYFVMENFQATESAQAWSGDVQPGFSHKVEAWMINPFFKLGGLEGFGLIEQAKGRNANETSDRTFNQRGGDLVYRFLGNQLYAAARYDYVTGRFPNGLTPPFATSFTDDAKVERIEAGGGWFLTQTMLAKIEYVRQNYMNFPMPDIRSGGHFHGVMVEATVAF